VNETTGNGKFCGASKNKGSERNHTETGRKTNCEVTRDSRRTKFSPRSRSRVNRGTRVKLLGGYRDGQQCNGGAVATRTPPPTYQLPYVPRRVGQAPLQWAGYTLPRAECRVRREMCVTTSSATDDESSSNQTADAVRGDAR